MRYEIGAESDDLETVVVDAPSASAAYGQVLLRLLKRRSQEQAGS